MAIDKTENKEFSLASVLYLLKKYFIIIVLIITLSVGAGYLYARLRIPTYSVSAEVTFKVKDSEDNTRTAINVQFAYVDTVIDFCRTGIVFDRANYYYDQFIKQGNKDIDAFVKEKTDNFDNNEDDYIYDPNAKYDKIFTSETTSTGKLSSDEQQSSFRIMVKKQAQTEDIADYEDLKARLKILIMSCDMESRFSFGEGASYIYRISIGGITSNVSVRRTVLISGGIGVIVAILAVVLLFLLDFTVKDSETLAKITGANVLAFIVDQEAR